MTKPIEFIELTLRDGSKFSFKKDDYFWHKSFIDGDVKGVIAIAHDGNADMFEVKESFTQIKNKMS